MEVALLVWFVVGAGIAAGAFIIARTAIQIASVAYNVLEKRLDPRVATRQTILLTLGGLAAVVATSIIAGIAILAMLSSFVLSVERRLTAFDLPRGNALQLGIESTWSSGEVVLICPKWSRRSTWASA